MRKFDAAFKLFEASGLDGEFHIVLLEAGRRVFCRMDDNMADNLPRYVIHATAKNATEATRQAIAGMRAMLAEAGLNPKPKRASKQ